MNSKASNLSDLLINSVHEEGGSGSFCMSVRSSRRVIRRDDILDVVEVFQHIQRECCDAHSLKYDSFMNVLYRTAGFKVYFILASVSGS